MDLVVIVARMSSEGPRLRDSGVPPHYYIERDVTKIKEDMAAIEEDQSDLMKALSALMEGMRSAVSVTNRVIVVLKKRGLDRRIRNNALSEEGMRSLERRIENMESMGAVTLRQFQQPSGSLSPHFCSEDEMKDKVRGLEKTLSFITETQMILMKTLLNGIVLLSGREKLKQGAKARRNVTPYIREVAILKTK